MKIGISSIAPIATIIAAVATSFGNAIDVGERVPSDLVLHHGFPPERHSLNERMKGKNILLVGLPGAFTPTW